MAAITTNQFLDGGTSRAAGEAFAIGNGAVFTIRTDSRIHANAPASFTGSLSSPTFTDIGGELIIDASSVREISYTGATGNTPAIGTAISQGGVSGYYLGTWASIGTAPVAVGAAFEVAAVPVLILMDMPRNRECADVRHHNDVDAYVVHWISPLVRAC